MQQACANEERDIKLLYTVHRFDLLHEYIDTSPMSSLIQRIKIKENFSFILDRPLDKYDDAKKHAGTDLVFNNVGAVIAAHVC